MNAQAAPALRDGFLQGMSRAANTVSVVTTDGAAGRAGVTISAMASVSADTPRPTLLVCVHHLSPAANAILANGVLCVNLLRDDQSFISDAFAGRFKAEIGDKFDCADWVAMASGAPRVRDPLVAFDCRVASANRVGTHHVIMAEVEDAFVAEVGLPLIHVRRAYGSPHPIEGVTSLMAGRDGAGAGLNVGCFHTFGPFVLPELIARLAAEDPTLTLRLVEGDQRRVQESLMAGEVELALLYDLDLDHEALTVTALTDIHPYVLLAADHPLAAQDRIAPADLADLPMVLLDVAPSRDYFPGLLRRHGVEPRIAFRSTTLEMVRGMVGQGLGYALLGTRPAAPTAYDGRPLTARPLAAEAPASRVVLAARAGAALSPAADRFAWACREHFVIEY